MRRLCILFALSAGCVEGATETVIVVHAQGLTLGTDLDALRIQVFDKVAVGEPQSKFEQDVLLRPMPEPPTSYTLPLSLTLVPGPERPNDSVLVRVFGLRRGVQVIGNAAVFSFARRVRQRLDFVLYANCLNVDCSTSDQACDITGRCVTLTPTQFMGPLNVDMLPIPSGDLSMMSTMDLAGDDLAMPDLSVPIDMSVMVPMDLAVVPIDMTTPIDMSIADLSMRDMAMGDMAMPPLIDMSGDMSIRDMAMPPLIDMSGDMSMPMDMTMPPPPDMSVLWRELQSGPMLGFFLHDVWGFSDTDVYVVGERCTVLHSTDGENFVPEVAFPSPAPGGCDNTTALHSVWGVNDVSRGQLVFAVGSNGKVLKKELGVWTLETVPNASSVQLRGVWGDAENDFHAVGTGLPVPTHATYDGNAWSKPCGDDTAAPNLHDVWGNSSSELFAVGESGIYQLGGEVCGMEVPDPMADLLGADMTSCTCQMTQISPLLGMRGMSGLPGWFFVAVGIGGSYVECTLGGGCAGFSTGFNVLLQDVFVVNSAMEYYAVGAQGTILHYNILTPGWSKEESGTNLELIGVWGGPGGAVYAVGNNGLILKRL